VCRRLNQSRLQPCGSPVRRKNRICPTKKAALEQFCIARGTAVEEWISEIGGDLNFKRPKFSDLVDQIIRSELSTLVIAHKDRLARFGFELLAHLCETHGVVLNTVSLSPEQEMVSRLGENRPVLFVPVGWPAELSQGNSKGNDR